MSTSSRIEWTDTTWNPTLGCTRVSAGCDGCYAIQTARTRAGHPNPKVSVPYAGLTERTAAGLDWTGTVTTLPERLALPLRWRKPRRIFVDSQSDLFHDGVPDEFIAQVFAIMAATPQHTYQVLTKRHGRMRSLLNAAYFPELVTTWSWRLVGCLTNRPLVQLPAPNVWLGVSAEDQKHADLRIPALLDTPAAVRFLSCEPLLGPVSLIDWMPSGHARWQCSGCRRFYSGEHRDVCPGCQRAGYWCGSHVGNLRPSGQPLGWLIAGGESGPRARPMHPDWARQLRDQCTAAGVPFFFKQRGEWTWDARPEDPWWQATPEAAVSTVGDLTTWEEATVRPGAWAGIFRVGKKRAGRDLDGRTWDGYPAVAG